MVYTLDSWTREIETPLDKPLGIGNQRFDTLPLHHNGNGKRYEISLGCSCAAVEIGIFDNVFFCLKRISSMVRTGDL